MALVKYNNNSISAVTSAAAIPSGDMTLIKTVTASSSATISFVDGSSDVVLDNTYPIYVFKFINIHAQTLDSEFTFNLSIIVTVPSLIFSERAILIDAFFTFFKIFK